MRLASALTSYNAPWRGKRTRRDSRRGSAAIARRAAFPPVSDWGFRPLITTVLLSRSDERSSEWAEAPPLLKLLKNIFREDWPLSFGGLVPFGGCVLSVTLAAH